MKVENVLLHSLFGACLIACLLVLGSMLTVRTPAASFAASQPPVAAATHAAS